MVRYLFYTIGDLTYQSPLVLWLEWVGVNNGGTKHTILQEPSLHSLSL